MYLMPMERIIRPAIFELFLKTATDFDAIFRSDSNIAAIEQAVEVAPQEQAVVHGVRPALVKRLDMGSLERGEGMLFCNRAGTVICIRNKDAKSALSQAGRDRGFFTVSSPFLLDTMGFPIQVKNPLMRPRVM